LLIYLLVVAVVLVAALLAFGLAALFHLSGSAYIVFVLAILLVGLAAAAAILWMHLRRKGTGAGELPSGGETGELDLLLNDANSRLRTSQQGARTLDSLPLVYVLGDSGSAKTTQVLRSGLDPELLAGTAAQVGDVQPTPLVNLWLTGAAAIVEAGAAVRQSGPLLTRLVERTRPRAYRSAFGPGAPARVAVVCLSADQLMAGDAGASAVASARATGAQLREISRLLGTPLPVYVIVTKLDRAPYFAEFVRNLSNEEAALILGATLPKSEATAGVYAHQVSKELGTVLDALCYSLGEFRVEMLARETEPANAPPVYEFPREFGKLRKALNQFLVELCKPSHLSVNPYLRGFYFTGIRAQLVERRSGAAAPTPEPQPSSDTATSFYHRSTGMGALSAQPAQQPTVVTTRVPQWTFLPRLFPQVILGDRTAQAATQHTAPARLFRRILFATLGALFLVYTVLLFVSYLNNAALESSILDAARALPITSGSNPTPSTADVRALDSLRKTILQLDGYQQHGAPLWYHWGLYQGDKLRDRARSVYFARFRPMLLAPAQENFATYLRNLPAAATNDTPYSQYNAGYSPLKAYLITAGYHEKSTSAFLTPVFLQYWIGTRTVDADQQDLARQQIDFYATELARHDPYSIQADNGIVQHAQGYLNSFGGGARIYQAMISDANKRNAGIDFNLQYPGSDRYVIDRRHVDGAYTRPGFAFMKDAILHADRYFAGESWVLGDQAAQGLDINAIRTYLLSTYPTDFIGQWNDFLARASIVGCGSVHDAPDRLSALAGSGASSGSPLLELLYTVSHHTAVDDQQIKPAFQSSQKIVDPEAAGNFTGPGNQTYTSKLLDIAGAITLVAANPNPDPNAGLQVNTAVVSAQTALRTIAQSFPGDAEHTDRRRVLELLNEPISCADGLANAIGTAPANGAGARICAAIRPLLAKYPFNPGSNTEAGIAEVNQVLAPDTGVLWVQYKTALNQLLPLQVSSYVAASPKVNPAFVQFFNRAAQISSKLYAPGAQNPAFNFSLRFISANGVSNPVINMDGQRVSTGPNSEFFKWSGADAHQASLVWDGGDATYEGPWAVFHLVKGAKWSRSADGTRLEFPLQTTFAGQNVSGNGHGVSYDLSGTGESLLNPSYFSGLSCPATVLR
jgi:type VI secretion system protein ImpL